MRNGLEEILGSYDDRASLAEASTIPGPWYVDSRIAELEAATVFGKTWQMVGRVEQVEKAGQFVTTRIAGEPIVVVRGNDQVLRAFYNVCRHHASAVVTEPCGIASILHCPYHGWNYGLDGSLKGMPEFEGVKNFERKDNGLVPLIRYLGEVRLHQSRPPVGLPFRLSRRHNAPGGAAGPRQAALFRPKSLRPALQLESLRGQLSRRRLPRAPLAQGIELGAQLQGLHHRK